MYKVLGYWSTITNLIACTIMLFVIKHVRNITRQFRGTNLPERMTSEVKEECRMNNFVTLSHIIFIITYTLISFLADNSVYIINQQDSTLRIASTWYCMAAILDIFVAYMMFFILDEGSGSPDIIRDEARKVSYPVI